MPALFGAVVLLALFLIFFLVAFRSAKRLSSPRLRRLVQVAATMGAALIVILLAGFVWTMYPLTARGPVVYSPDGERLLTSVVLDCDVEVTCTLRRSLRIS